MLFTSSSTRLAVLTGLLALTAFARPIHNGELAPRHDQLADRQLGGLIDTVLGGLGIEDKPTSTADAPPASTATIASASVVEAETTTARAPTPVTTTTTQADLPTSAPAAAALKTTTTARQAATTTAATLTDDAVESTSVKSVKAAPATSPATSSTDDVAVAFTVSSTPLTASSAPTKSPAPSQGTAPSSSAAEVQKAAVQATTVDKNGETITRNIPSSPLETGPATANDLAKPSPSPLSPANSLFPLVISGIIIGGLLSLALIFLLFKKVISSSEKSKRWDNLDLPWQSDDSAAGGVGGTRPWSEIGSVEEGRGGAGAGGPAAVGRSASTRSVRTQMSETDLPYAPHRGPASSEGFGAGGYEASHYDRDARELGAVDARARGGPGAGWGPVPEPMGRQLAGPGAVAPPMYEQSGPGLTINAAREMLIRDAKGRLV